MIRVLLVDDHKIFTEGLVALLLKENDFQVVGECQNASQVKEHLQLYEIDVVLLDINLGKDSGLELCKYISEKFPRVNILGMSMYHSESFITKMLKNGASGYILKNTGAKELLEAIRIISEGKTYQSAEVIDIILNGLSRQKQPENNIHYIRFTRREKEILELISEGKTIRQMAENLFISEKTVEAHRSNLFTKFNVKNVLSLLKVALEHGYVK